LPLDTAFTIDGSGAEQKVSLGGSSRFIYLPAVSIEDIDLSATGSVAPSGGLPLGGRVEILGVMWRITDISHYYMARVNVATDGTLSLFIYGTGDSDEVAHRNGLLSGATYTSGEVLTIRVQVFGAAIRAKVWITANGEPDAWDLTAFSNAYIGAGAVGIRSGVGSGNTNTKPVVTTYTEFWAAPNTEHGGGKFLDNVLGDHSIAYLEIAPGADLTQLPSEWTFVDITKDLREDAGFKATKGRPDQAKQAQPSTGATALNNPLGDYTNRRAASQYWPYMRRDLPIRFGVDVGGYSERFGGFVDSIIPSYMDISGRIPISTITASGILRRLGQGDNPIRTPFVRSVLGNASLGLVRYWPCEDLATADSCASALPGQAPMLPGGIVTFGGMNYAAPLTAAANAPVILGLGLQPLLTAGGSISATFAAGSATSWTVQFATFVDGFADVGPTLLAQWTTQGTTSTWKVFWEFDVGFTLTVDGASVAVLSTGIIASLNVTVNDMRVDAIQVGSDIHVTFLPVVQFGSVTGTISGETLGGVNGFTCNPNQTATTGEFSVGQVRIWDGNSAPDFRTAAGVTSAWNAWQGETPDARMIRLCAEENIPIVVTGESLIVMGQQPIDTILNILRMCEATDQGELSDGVNFGLAYTCFTSRVNARVALALNCAAGDVGGILAPVDDDQTPANDVTYQQGLTLTGSATGTSARAVDDVSVQAHGATSTTVTVNTLDSSPLAGLAAWDVHLAGVDVERYSSLPLNLAASPNRVPDWLSAVEGERITVDNLPPQSTDGDVDVLLEGWTETISVYDWTATLNTSPAQGWAVTEIETDGFDVVQASGSVCSGSAAAGTSPLNIGTTDGTLITQNPDDCPFDISINGERMTVTAVGAPSAGVQPITVTRAVNDVSKPTSDGDVLSVWASSVIGR